MDPRVSFVALEGPAAQGHWIDCVAALDDAAASFGPAWREHPLPGERAWRMEVDGRDAGWVSLEPWGWAARLTNTLIRPAFQGHGLRSHFRRWYVHQAFSDPQVELVAAEILLSSPYAISIKRDPGAPWRLIGELWHPRPKLLIGLTREEALHAGVIPHQLYAPEPLWPGFCWVDSGLGDRWKVWRGPDSGWDRLGARNAHERTVIEHPFCPPIAEGR